MNKNLWRNIGFIFICCLAVVVSAHANAYRSPEYVEGAKTVTLTEAKRLHDQGVVFIDVRNPRFFASGHIPGAFHFDFKYNFSESLLDSVVKKNQPIVIYCSGIVCSRSYRASAKALGWGFENVYYFRGGFADWKDAGYEVTRNE